MDKKNILLLSSIFSKSDEYDLSVDDIKYQLNQNVTDCEFILYIEIIKMLANGVSYAEIFNYIDKFSSLEYEKLLEDEKGYVKSKVKKDLNKRIMIDKLKGEDKYE